SSNGRGRRATANSRQCSEINRHQQTSVSRRRFRGRCRSASRGTGRVKMSGGVDVSVNRRAPCKTLQGISFCGNRRTAIAFHRSPSPPRRIVKIPRHRKVGSYAVRRQEARDGR
ncbi:hypothetical protein, partial [Lyngbya sp. CCY1209]|uniref:hypothetical protein n=1 Tax=Lyngbya sp. CCY1209 TaxID=2886103 RepID=UPI002D200AC6